MKLASFHTGRKKVLAFHKAFHGRTSLAVAATDNPAIVAPVNQTDNIVFAPFNDIAALEKVFQQHEFAAVIIEGIQGVGGIRVAEDAFLKRLRALCDAHKTVLIADSVQCGYGRSGSFFAHDLAGIGADLYTMAKGMGNGFPVAGVLIAPHFQAKHGLLGTTFGGNPLACAAALAVLEIMEQDKLIENAEKTGQYLMDALRAIPQIANVRGKGLMIGFDVPAEQGELRKRLLFEQGVFTGEAKGGVVRLLPSLALSKADADIFLEKLEASLLK